MRRVGFRCSATYDCPKNDMMEEITSFVMSLDTTERRENISISSAGDVIEAGVFFVDVPVRFTLGEKTLRIEVDSTMVGPGYHATMIQTLRYMNEVTSANWDWSTLQDDTGYSEHGDFARLQAYMQDWLKEYCRELISTPNLRLPVYTNLIMPYGMFPIPANGRFACHATGYVHKDFFTYIHKFDETSYFCRSFFLWWDLEMDAEFYVKCALSIIWCRLNWLPPVQEDEVRDVDNALMQLENAWQMDKSLHLPVPEWLELAQLLGDLELADELIRRFPTAINQPPSKGYRRNDVFQVLGNKTWKIKLPGKMHSALDEDGALMFWDHDERSIRIVPTTNNDANGEPIPASLLLQESLLGAQAKPHLLPADLSIPAFVLHEAHEKDGAKVYSTALYAAMDGSAVTVSIFYSNRNQRTWALEVCNSLAPISI